MPYDFELTFTGLCVFVFKGENKRLPDWVQVLLIRTDDQACASDPSHEHEDGHEGGGTEHRRPPRHFPRLSFSFDDIAFHFPDRRTEIVAGPNGRLICGQDISHEVITIATEGEPLPLRAVWRPDGEQVLSGPRNKDEEEWLDWVPSVQNLAPSVPGSTPSDPFAGLDLGRVVARVILTGGILRAAEVARLLNNQYVAWDFKENDAAAFDDSASQAVADHVILRIPDADGVITLRGLGGDLVQLSEALRPGRGLTKGLVQASITNLPQEDVGLDAVLHHFSLLGTLLQPALGSTPLKFPHAQQSLQTCSSSSICPNVIHNPKWGTS